MTDGLRFDPLAARTEIRDAIADYAIPALGPEPNVFGQPDRVLGAAEQLLQSQQDRYSITEATPLGWVSNVVSGGDTQVYRLATRDTTFVDEPWDLIPWVFPGDAVVTINGTPLNHRGVDEQLGWSQLGQQLTLGLTLAPGETIDQDPTDVITVSIPDADWMTDYLDGSKHVRLDHLDGSDYYAYVPGLGRWEAVERVPLVDAEIWADRIPDARAAWVGFGEMTSTLELRYMTGRRTPPVSGDLTIEIEIGSGAHHTGPDESDAVAYGVMGQLVDVVAHLPRLADGSRVEVTGHRTLQSWRTHEDRETVLALQLTVESK